MRITIAQTSPKLSRNNLESVVSIIDRVKQDSDLIVFPELALSGYLLQDKLYEDAWTLEEIDILKELSLHVDIALGAAIKEKDVFRNTALYFSKGKLLSKHSKVHLPNYGMFEEARYFKAGDGFKAFTTEYGKCCMAVCEDLWHKETHESIKELSPDIILALAASPARGFSDEGMLIEKRWYEIVSNLAKECGVHVVFVNRVGFEDGLGFWGGSCIVGKDGNISKKMPLYKEMLEIFEI